MWAWIGKALFVWLLVVVSVLVFARVVARDVRLGLYDGHDACVDASDDMYGCVLR